jgi:carboxyl-terminal processing protease
MKTPRPFPILVLIILMTWVMAACSARQEQPAAPRQEASATPAAEATPSPTARPTATPTLAPTHSIQSTEHAQILETVWSTVNESYFDPDFGGLDWAAVRARYEPLVMAAKDDDELYHLLNQMLWELNVSHAAVGPLDKWPAAEPVVWMDGDIGIDVRLLGEQAVITRVRAGSPAEEAGLHTGFAITAIDGTTVEQIIADTQERLAPPYNEQGRVNLLTLHLLSLIYGEPSACVNLAYLDERDAVRESCVERMPRPRMAALEGAPIPPSYLEFESRRLADGIGYIRFNTFHPDLMPDLIDALAEFQDAPGVIVDLRGNPGGELETDGEMAAQFLDGQVTIGRFETRSGTMPWVVTGENAYSGPLVILIDALSFSGSEFFASGLQAVGRAVIAGERSPGGATVGNVAPLLNNAILVYPVAQLLTPGGQVVEGHGVIPDIPVPLERGQLLDGIDAQLQAAIQYVVETVR